MHEVFLIYYQQQIVTEFQNDNCCNLFVAVLRIVQYCGCYYLLRLVLFS